MLKIVTAAGMRAIDQDALEHHGRSAQTLMDQAGAALAAAARSFWPATRPGRVVVLAGPGKNGGDGLACARYLANGGVQVRVLFLPGSGPVPETEANLKALSPAVRVDAVPSLQPEQWTEALHWADVVVDALLGLGASGTPRDPAADLIRAVNDAEVSVLAADLPSGLDPDTGTPHPTTIRARRTVTFGLPKLGLLMPTAAAYVGALQVARLGFPGRLLEADEQEPGYVTGEDVRAWLPWRAPETHKRQAGRVLVLGGSSEYHGAPLLSAAGAIRSGAGYVTLGYPGSLDGMLRAHTVEEMCRPLPDGGEGCFGPASLEAALQLASSADAVVLGPGLGRQPQTMQWVISFLRQIAGPRVLVVDADALVALARTSVPARPEGPVRILTPHAGEAANLLGRTPEEVQADRPAAARELADRFKDVVVLKGRHTVVASPGAGAWVIGSGSPALATAGTGDVLAGMIAALGAVVPGPRRAAALAAWVHGAAGELASVDPGGLGLRASDVAEKIPFVFQGLRFRPTEDMGLASASGQA